MQTVFPNITNPRKIVDQCSKAILNNDKDKIQEHCPYVTEPEMSDLTTRLSDREWAYSTNEMSKLITTCPKEETEVTTIILPHNGIIKFPESSDCDFEFLNGPFRYFQPYLPNLNMTVKQFNVKFKQELTKLKEIQKHVQENMIYYIFGIITFIIITIICISSTWCIVSLCKKRKARKQMRETLEKRRQRRQEEETHQQMSQQIIQIPMRAQIMPSTSTTTFRIRDLQPPWAEIPTRRV